jgi:ABC-type branched-subunit amino acid transport system ATPase component
MEKRADRHYQDIRYSCRAHYPLPRLLQEETAIARRRWNCERFNLQTRRTGRGQPAYGQQRKLEIARALATTKMLLLDEPAAACPTEPRAARLHQPDPQKVQHTILLSGTS